MGFPLFLSLPVENRKLHRLVNLQGIVPIFTDSRKKLCSVLVKIVERESTQGQSSTPLQLVSSNAAAIGDDQTECSCIGQIVVPCVRSFIIRRNWKRLALEQGAPAAKIWGLTWMDRDRVKGAQSSSMLEQRLWIIEQKIGRNPEGSRRSTWR
ncbi:hypothetical protein F0562_025557 [Nyssa sinensis]|uniref:Uncharacterized protein n=1 Tax=Nyssa sinensis TaxID=561372 RepID=A0A5J5B6N3_9ASTE|nr:hypothetical protein F0562_025557 [Nyssa sinensis]